MQSLAHRYELGCAQNVFHGVVCRHGFLVGLLAGKTLRGRRFLEHGRVRNDGEVVEAVDLLKHFDLAGACVRLFGGLQARFVLAPWLGVHISPAQGRREQLAHIEALAFVVLADTVDETLCCAG